MKKNIKHSIKKVAFPLIIIFIISFFCSGVSYTSNNSDTPINFDKEIDYSIDYKEVTIDIFKGPFLRPLIETTERDPVQIRITAVGDIMMHSGQIRSGYNDIDKTYNYNEFFKFIEPIIKDSDLSIANLETTLAGNKEPYAGYPRFNSPDEIVDALKFAGFDTIVTANNHSLDTGISGLKRTREVITEASLTAVGTHNASLDRNFLVQSINGIKVVVISYTQHLNGLDSGYSSEILSDVINIIDEEQIINDFKKIRKESPDLTIAYMHWGQEYQKYPSAFQEDYAKLLAEQGVDIIIGSHPHVIQPKTTIKSENRETLVFYSLGNFISNQRRETLGEEYKATENGVILDFLIEKNMDSNKIEIVEMTFHPTWVQRYKEKGQSTYTYHIVPIEWYLSKEMTKDGTLINLLKDSMISTYERLNSYD